MKTYKNPKIITLPNDEYAIRYGYIFHRYLVPAFPAYSGIDDLSDVSKEELAEVGGFVLHEEVVECLNDLMNR